MGTARSVASFSVATHRAHRPTLLAHYWALASFVTAPPISDLVYGRFFLVYTRVEQHASYVSAASYGVDIVV